MRRFETKLKSVEQTLTKELTPSVKTIETISGDATTAAAAAAAAAASAVALVHRGADGLQDVAGRVDSAEVKLAGVSSAVDNLRREMETKEATAVKDAYAANEEWGQAKGQLKQLEQAVWESVMLLQTGGGSPAAPSSSAAAANTDAGVRKFQLPGSFLFRKKESPSGGGGGGSGRTDSGRSSGSGRPADTSRGPIPGDFTVNPVLL
jgi:hypothetical protein